MTFPKRSATIREPGRAIHIARRDRLGVPFVAALLQVLAIGLSAPALAQPPAPTIDSVGPGSLGELRILWSWSLGDSACDGVDSYQVDYKKSTEPRWYTYTLDHPNDTEHGTFEILGDILEPGFTSKLFLLGPNTTGHNPGEIGLELEDVSYDVRMVVYSRTCEEDDPFGISAPVSGRPGRANNSPPEVASAIADQSVRAGGAVDVDLQGVFSDDDGDTLALSAASSDTDSATVAIDGNTLTVNGGAVGSATVTVTANDGHGGTVDDTFTVTVTEANSPPVVASAIADQSVRAGGAVDVDLQGVFSDDDGDTLALSAASSDINLATVAIDGNTLTVNGVAVGSATVTVTANDGHGGTVDDTFTVTVSDANNSPVVASAIADQSVRAGGAVDVDLQGVFSDDDGDTLALSAASSDINLATVAIDGNTLTVNGVAVGSATVTVTANDGHGGTVDDTFTVTVSDANNSPVVASAIADQSVRAGGAVDVDLQGVFSDDDGDTLALSAASSDTNLATVAIDGNTLTVNGVAVGSATVTVTANDGHGGTVDDTFTVTVSDANNSPVVASAIADQSVRAGGAVDVDLQGVFSDDDGDTLALSAASSDINLATVAIDGNTLTVNGVAVGSATVTVTANDGYGGTVDDTFTVTVSDANNSPVVASAIADQSVRAGGAVDVDLQGVFSDDDGDTLTLSAASSDTNLATAAVNGNTLTVNGVAVGSATVTVTANDGYGGTVDDTFTVTVTDANTPPAVANAIADQSVRAGGAVDVDLQGVFSDDDGDTLTLSAASSDTNLATVAVNGNTLTVNGVAVGSATVTVTANDGYGGTVDDTFTVTVTDANTPPAVANAIADQSVAVGASVDVALDGVFTDDDRDALTLAAVSSDTTLATVVLTETTLTVTGVAVGAPTVTVTANDGYGGTADAPFTVTVTSTSTPPPPPPPPPPPDNNPPEVATAIADQAVGVGASADVALDGVFTDPDGDTLTLSAVSSDTTSAAVAVTGNTLTITGVAAGIPTVTVSASDGKGGNVAAPAFTVTVSDDLSGGNNTPPLVMAPIADRTVAMNRSIVVELSGVFNDADGDALTLSAVSSDTTKAAVSLSGTRLTLTGVGVGDATVTVTADDGQGGAVDDAFAVTVTAPILTNSPPVVAAPLANRSVARCGIIVVALDSVFSDPDGLALNLSAVSSDTTKATVSLSGATLTVTGAGVGDTTVTVTATDPGGLAVSNSFLVTVVEASCAENAPRLDSPIADRMLTVGETVDVVLTSVFSDPDGDALTLRATSGDTSKATVSLSGTTLRVTGVAPGTATVTVTATDPGGLGVTDHFVVTVTTPVPTLPLVAAFALAGLLLAAGVRRLRGVS